MKGYCFEKVNFVGHFIQRDITFTGGYTGSGTNYGMTFGSGRT